MQTTKFAAHKIAHAARQKSSPQYPLISYLRPLYPSVKQHQTIKGKFEYGKINILQSFEEWF